MTALELLNQFTKGGELAVISDKQVDFLLGLCKKEGIKSRFDGAGYYIEFCDFLAKISSCRRWASAGSYGAKKNVSGKYRLEKKYRVRFLDSGLMELYDAGGLDYLKSNGYKFEILKGI